MFPLNSNDQYIDSNGKRSKLGDAIGSGGSELPEYSEADAGKVLKVADDGSLEWDEDGGAGVEIISKSEWDLMTYEQKIAKGLIIIQRTEYGFDLGDYVNGHEYIAGIITSLVMTSNTYLTDAGLTFTASASSVYSGQEPYHAFNQYESPSGTQCWHPNSGYPQWIAIDFTVPVKVREFVLKSRASNVEHPSVFKLQGSNDGEVWTDIQSYTWSESGYGLTLECEVTNPVYYEQYRLYITEGINQYGVLGAWQFKVVET